MTNSMHIRVLFFCVTAGLGLGVASGAAASVGSVQPEGRMHLESEASGDSLRLRGDRYSIESGDTLRSSGGYALVTLAGGGSVGVDADAEVVFETSDAGTDVVHIKGGRLLYAFPSSRQDYEIRAGDFAVTPGTASGAMQVGQDPEDYSGMIEYLDDGNLKISSRSGDLQVASGSNRYTVASGSELGLLAGEFGRTDVQMGLDADELGPLIELESPERVATDEDFLVRWFGETEDRDLVAVAESGADPEEFITVSSVSEGEALEFTAPSEPGEYEIRHIDAATGEVTSFVFLDVVADGVAPVAWWARDGFVQGMALGIVTTGAVAYLTCDCDDDPPVPPPVSP